jgi:L-ascorbate metabolism protein UlaG (beta-lactamase superfamily)
MPTTRWMNQRPVFITGVWLLGAMLFNGPLRGQGLLVKVTPLGSHSGELCSADRALLFEDPTGVRILYDPGATTDETDSRLGDVHVILLSHGHADHIGSTRANRGGGTCAAPASGPTNSSSNVGTIAANRNSAVFVTAELTNFLGTKIQGIRGTATPACAASVGDDIIVPRAAPCMNRIGVSGSRNVRRGGSAPVRISAVQANHENSIPGVLIDPPGLPAGLNGFGGVAMGFVMQFTNGLTVYLTGDTGIFSDMGQIIAKFYRPNLMVINLGRAGSLGPEEAANIVRHFVRPTTVMPSHVQEQATSGGTLRGTASTEVFVREARQFVEVVLPISDVTLAFDGEGRCIGCPR